MNTVTIFANRITNLRKENKYTQQVVAQYIGVSRQAYALYEKAETFPNSDTLVLIAALYYVSVDYLLGRTEVRIDDSSIMLVSQMTGLTEDSIEELFYIKTKISKYKNLDSLEAILFQKVISSIITSDDIMKFVNSLTFIKHYEQELENHRNNFGEDNPSYRELDECLEVSKFRTSKISQRIIDELLDKVFNNHESEE